MGFQSLSPFPSPSLGCLQRGFTGIILQRSCEPKNKNLSVVGRLCQYAEIRSRWRRLTLVVIQGLVPTLATRLLLNPPECWVHSWQVHLLHPIPRHNFALQRNQFFFFIDSSNHTEIGRFRPQR